MPKLFAHAALIASFLATANLPSIAAENSSGLEPLQGTWSVTKTNAEGHRYSQFMEITKDRLIFRLNGEDDQLRFYAKGTLKADKSGAFDILTISDMKGGRSAEDLESVDGNRALVFALREGKLILASNLDKERENEKPSLDSYVRVEPAKAAGGDESKLLGTWKAEITYGDNKLDYDLRIAKADGKLEATLVSPRSGDHKCKTTTYKGGELVMEIDREIQGTDVTLIYKAKLTAEGLTGTVDAKGFESQLNGHWKASK